MEIKYADVAELVDARDLKSFATPKIASDFCKTSPSGNDEHALTGGDLQNISRPIGGAR